MGIEEQENEAEQKEAQPGVQGQGSLGRPPGGRDDCSVSQPVKGGAMKDHRGVAVQHKCQGKWSA